MTNMRSDDQQQLARTFMNLSLSEIHFQDLDQIQLNNLDKTLASKFGPTGWVWQDSVTKKGNLSMK